MLLPELAARTRELKETQKGVAEMNAALERAFERIKTEAYDEGVLIGERRGMKQGSLNTLFGLVRGGLLDADIASQQAGLPLSVFTAQMAEHDARQQR